MQIIEKYITNFITDFNHISIILKRRDWSKYKELLIANYISFFMSVLPVHVSNL